MLKTIHTSKLSTEKLKTNDTYRLSQRPICLSEDDLSSALKRHEQLSQGEMYFGSCSSEREIDISYKRHNSSRLIKHFSETVVSAGLTEKNCKNV